MSMDIILYTACAISLPADLPEPQSWKNYGGSDWAYESDSWQVIVDVDPDNEIPSEAASLFENLRFTIPVTLEPIGAGKEGYDFLELAVQKVVEKCGGVMEGPTGFEKIEPSGSE